jgi:phosphohistidine phosphatase
VVAGRVLWVLRHAKTHRKPPLGGGDHERTLDARGRRDADALGRRLGDDGDRLGLDPALVPQLVLCSTAARAVETTERVLAAMADPPPVSYLHSLYEASPKDVLVEVTRADDGARSVMTVGHNPTLEALVATLPRSPVAALLGGFPTCGLAVFDLPAGPWVEVAPRLAEVIGVFVPPY